MRCRIFPHRVADGPSQMAMDEAMLEAVAEDPTAALLRTYGWSVPTLSLGYFQQITEAEADPRWDGVPIVRRPTGGGAIWHDRELTYALVLPASHPIARPSAAFYRAVHAAIAGLLAARGVVADRRGPSPAASDAGRPFLCFEDRDPEDLVSRGSKVVGSAQRRRHGAVLQHGSLLLGHSPRTPGLPGVADLATAPSDPLDWSASLADHLPRALALAPVREGLPEGLERRALDLGRTTYRTDAWTRRR
jgi:lipoate-protein ligase A